jgi:hypothetical protein
MLTDSASSVPVNATRQGTKLSGTIGVGSSRLPFSAILRGKQLILETGGDAGETVTFTRSDRSVAAASTMNAPAPLATARRHVTINRQRLSDDELARLEQQYHVRLPDADFWYDSVLGAWGLQGGPTRGFTTAGLRLGGALQADASGAGATHVFVNGRELPIVDLLGLQQVTGPIAPGRYFITAMGLAGYEGGPPQWDLRAMLAQSQRSGGGGRSDWQGGILGSSGFSDGETGAVFLPGGGNVSYGSN